MWIKIVIFLTILGVVGGSLYWAQQIIDERAKLEIEVDGLLVTNQSVVQDNDFLRQDAENKGAFLVEREEFIEELGRDSKKLRGELANAKRKLSAEDRVCLDTDMPEPYLSRLRQRTSKDREADDQNMPVGSVIPAVLVRAF